MTAIADTKKESALKIVNIAVFIISCFLFVCLITTKHLGSVTESISGALLGVFGLSAYGIAASAITLSALSLWGKNAIKPRHIVIFSLLYFSIMLFVHLVTSTMYMDNIEYGQYLARCFDFFSYPSYGGVIAGIFVFPIARTSIALAYILFILFMLVTLYFSANCITEMAAGNSYQRPVSAKKEMRQTKSPVLSIEEGDLQEESAAQKLKGAVEKLYGKGAEIKKDEYLYKEKSAEEKLATDIPLSPPKSGGIYPHEPVSKYSNSTESGEKDLLEGLKTGRKIPLYNSTELTDADALSNSIRQGKILAKDNKQAQDSDTTQFDFNEQEEEGVSGNDDNALPYTTPQIDKSVIPQEKLDLSGLIKSSENNGFTKEKVVFPSEIFAEGENNNEEEEELVINDIQDDFEVNANDSEIIKETAPAVSQKPLPTVSFTEEIIDTSNGSANQFKMKISYGEEKKVPFRKYPAYNPPPIELLKESPNKAVHSQEEIQTTAKLLEETLLSFRIEAKVENVVAGPTVTRYELRMTPGTSVKKVITIADDIAMNLSAVGSVRIEPQILGKDLFGVEVPNKNAETVTLRTIVDSDEFYRANGNLDFALGMDIGGRRIIPDLADMPHLLVAGATGMGKSVFLNSLIVSLMYKYSPEELRFLLVDPKQVEFFVFKNSPHLLIEQVITQPEQCIAALTWLVEEMERRYALFKEIGAKNITDYNRRVNRENTQTLPRIALVIDELNDLMSNFKQDLETQIKSLAQKARAAGIHLVFATQRPSIDVLTGTIKANFPCRIALKTISFADSKTILDQGGADKLVGRGDMLYISATTPKPVRLQGCYVSMTEVENVLEYISAKNKAFFDEEAEKKILRVPNKTAALREEDDEELDPLFWEALKYCIEQNSASISLLQRKFLIGYNRAGRIIEQFYDKKFISEFDGAKSRRVLITADEYSRLHEEEEY